MASGARGTVRWGKETTWGTAAATFTGMEALTESLALAYDRYAVKTIIGTIAEPDDFAGVGRIAGDLTVPGYPDYVGRLLQAVFATTVVSLATGLAKSTFRTRLANFSTDTPVQPISLDVFRDVTSADRYTGLVVSRLTLGCQPNQDLRLTASMIGKATATVANTAPSYPSSPLQPFAFDTASLALDGAGTALIETLTVAIDSQLEGIPALNATSQIAKIRTRGSQTIGLSGAIDFATRAEYAKFEAQSEQALTLYLTRPSSFSLLMAVPRFLYRTFAPTMTGPERVVVNFDGSARYAVSGTYSGTAIQFELTSVTSDF